MGHGAGLPLAEGRNFESPLPQGEGQGEGGASLCPSETISPRRAPAGWTTSLFTDADIAHGEKLLKSLVLKAEREQLDLASLMVLLRRETFWETLLIPAFVFLFSDALSVSLGQSPPA